jgi:hypothetical protein
MVVRHGGHAMGLSAQMPAQGETLSDADIADVVACVKMLTDSRAYSPGEMNFFLPVRTKKAFPEDEVVWKSRWTHCHGDDVWRNVIEVEKRVGKRFSDAWVFQSSLRAIFPTDDAGDGEVE